MEGADLVLLDEHGERIPWPVALGGDKGYRADWIDEYLLDLGTNPVIPSRENEDRDARSVDFDKEACRRCNIVERLIGWLKRIPPYFLPMREDSQELWRSVNARIHQAVADL